MSDKIVANRYATALLKVAGDAGGPQTKAKLAALEGVLTLFDVPDAAKVLRSPVMPKDLKLALLKYAAEKAGGDQQILAFVESVADAGRVPNLPAIVEAFRDLIDQADGIIRANVASAAPMNAAELAEIQKALETLTNKKVVVTARTEPMLLGGFVARLGNNLVDLSLRSKLDALTSSAAV